MYAKDYAPLRGAGCLRSLPHCVWHVILPRLWCFHVLSFHATLWTGDVVLRFFLVLSKLKSVTPTFNRLTDRGLTFGGLTGFL
jgi:hypothetical protein